MNNGITFGIPQNGFVEFIVNWFSVVGFTVSGSFLSLISLFGTGKGHGI